MNMISDVEKKLSSIKPRKLSQKERRILWSEVQTGIVSARVSAHHSDRYRFYNIQVVRYLYIYLQKKKVAAIGLVAIGLVLSSSVIVMSANSARPGDFLFPIDLAAEKVQLAFSAKKNHNVLKVRFSEERLEEVKEILKEAEQADLSLGTEVTINTSATSSTTTTTTSQTTRKNDERINNALVITLDYLEKTKSEAEADNNNSSTEAIDGLINELMTVAEKRASLPQRFDAKIKDNRNKTRVEIKKAREDDEYTKEATTFKETKNYKTNGNNSTSISPERNDDSTSTNKDATTKRQSEDNAASDDNEITDDNGGTPDRYEKKEQERIYLDRERGDYRKDGEEDDNEDNDEHTISGAIGTTDAVAPVISEIGTIAGTSTALISWKTNEVADGMVWYGTTTPVTFGAQISDTDTTTASAAFSARQSALTMDHAITLSSLQSNTVYRYILASTDNEGNTTTFAEQIFKTSSQ